MFSPLYSFDSPQPYVGTGFQQAGFCPDNDADYPSSPESNMHIDPFLRDLDSVPLPMTNQTHLHHHISQRTDPSIQRYLDDSQTNKLFNPAASVSFTSAGPQQHSPASAFPSSPAYSPGLQATRPLTSVPAAYQLRAGSPYTTTTQDLTSNSNALSPSLESESYYDTKPSTPGDMGITSTFPSQAALSCSFNEDTMTPSQQQQQQSQSLSYTGLAPMVNEGYVNPKDVSLFAADTGDFAATSSLFATGNNANFMFGQAFHQNQHDFAAAANSGNVEQLPTFDPVARSFTLRSNSGTDQDAALHPQRRYEQQQQQQQQTGSSLYSIATGDLYPRVSSPELFHQEEPARVDSTHGQTLTVSEGQMPHAEQNKSPALLDNNVPRTSTVIVDSDATDANSQTSAGKQEQQEQQKTEEEENSANKRRRKSTRLPAASLTAAPGARSASDESNTNTNNTITATATSNNSKKRRRGNGSNGSSQQPAAPPKPLAPGTAEARVPCSACRKTFKDKAEFEVHNKKVHVRPFYCILKRYGCQCAFAARNEWKRHVLSQHLKLVVWLCLEPQCDKTAAMAAAGAAGGSRSVVAFHDVAALLQGGETTSGVFNRKDLYTQHHRRMHMPDHLKTEQTELYEQQKQKQKQQQASQLAAGPSGSGGRGRKAAAAAAAAAAASSGAVQLSSRDALALEGSDELKQWNAVLKDKQKDAEFHRCALPTYMECPVPTCSHVFKGATAWVDRMEHVAKHMQSAADGHEPPVVFGGAGDPTLMNWLTRPDVNVLVRVEGEDAQGEPRWAINELDPIQIACQVRQMIVDQGHGDREGQANEYDKRTYAAQHLVPHQQHQHEHHPHGRPYYQQAVFIPPVENEEEDCDGDDDPDV